MVEFDVIMFCWGGLVTFIKRLTNARYANFGEKFALDTMLKRNDDNDDDDDDDDLVGVDETLYRSPAS